MNLSTASATSALNAICEVLISGNLKLYSGTIPATPETAFTGSLLATFVFSATPFTTPSLASTTESTVASFVSSTVTPSASGTVGYGRATITAAAWIASTVYSTVNTMVTANSNLYQLLKSGTSTTGTGPSTTSNSIADGTCQWAYYGPATALTVADFTVGTTAGFDIVVGSTVLSNVVPVTLSSFAMTTSAL